MHTQVHRYLIAFTCVSSRAAIVSLPILRTVPEPFVVVERAMHLRPIRTRRPASNAASVDAGSSHGALTDHTEDLNGRDGGVQGDVISHDNAESTTHEPVTPASRAFLDPSLNVHILTILGCKDPVDIDAFKSGLRQTLLKHKRFHSVIRKSEDGKLLWVPTSVNLDEHIVIAGEDANSATFVEDYVAQLAHAPPLDSSRPLFEIHVLRAKLGDACENLVFRVHHAMGDGISLMSLMLACTRKAEDPKSLPTLPTLGVISPTKENSCKAWLRLVWSFLLVLWFTFWDMCIFIATILWLDDSQSPLKGSLGVEKLSKKFSFWVMPMEDIHSVKQAIKGTVNDVVFGMVAAGLSSYLQQKYAEILEAEDSPTNKLVGSKHVFENQKSKEMLSHLRIRACILMNTRPSPGLQEIEDMMKTGSKVRWGNQMGYVILSVPVMAFENPVEYAIKAKTIMDKKKRSLGAAMSYKSAAMLMNIMGPQMPTRLTLSCSSHTTFAFSNMSGPLEEVEFFGTRVTHIIPTVVGQPQALCVHVQSYMGKATVVVSAATDVIPDPDRLCKLIASSLEEMKENLPSKQF